MESPSQLLSTKEWGSFQAGCWEWGRLGWDAQGKGPDCLPASAAVWQRGCCQWPEGLTMGWKVANRERLENCFPKT